MDLVARVSSDRLRRMAERRFELNLPHASLSRTGPTIAQPAAGGTTLLPTPAMIQAIQLSVLHFKGYVVDGNTPPLQPEARQTRAGRAVGAPSGEPAPRRRDAPLDSARQRLEEERKKARVAAASAAGLEDARAQADAQTQGAGRTTTTPRARAEHDQRLRGVPPASPAAGLSVRT